MKLKIPTYAIIIDDRRVKKDGKYPLKLRITYERERKYYNAGLDFSKSEWEKINNSNARGYYRSIKLQLSETEKKAKNIIDGFIENEEEFSFNRFEQLFFNENNSSGLIHDVYKEKIDELVKSGKVGTSETYQNALRSFTEFFKEKQVKFKEITPQILEQYEDWFVNEMKNSHSTASIYIRTLRALFNEQIDKGYLKQELYPFGRRKYIVPASKRRDLALSKNILKELWKYEADTKTNEAMSKDLWFFMYLSNGMNLKDVCRLRYSNLKNDHFTFVRAKTEGTSKEVNEIIVPLSKPLKDIIEKWGNVKGQNDRYIFPFYKAQMAPIEERKICQNLSGVINDNMNKVSKKLELGVHITTYSARHSHSNMLKDLGAPVKLIADSLGHTNSLTTEKHYMKRYEFDQLKGYNDQLLDF